LEKYPKSIFNNTKQAIFHWESEGFNTAQDNPPLLFEKEIPITIFIMS